MLFRNYASDIDALRSDHERIMIRLNRVERLLANIQSREPTPEPSPQVRADLTAWIDAVGSYRQEITDAVEETKALGVAPTEPARQRLELQLAAADRAYSALLMFGVQMTSRMHQMRVALAEELQQILIDNPISPALRADRPNFLGAREQ